MNSAPSLPSMREALTLAFRRKWRIILAFVLPPIIAVAVSFLMTPQYGAYTKLLVKAGREFLAQSDAVHPAPVAPSSTMQESINSEIEILTSRDLSLEVLHDIGIDKVYPDLAEHPPRNMSLDDAALAQHFVAGIGLE